MVACGFSTSLVALMMFQDLDGIRALPVSAGAGFDGVTTGSGFGGAGGPESIHRIREPCPACTFNARALEAFTQDFMFVSFEGSVLNATTTTPLYAADKRIELSGTVTLDSRHMQAKLSLHEVDRSHLDRTVDWELLVDGTMRRATLRISSSRLDVCISSLLPTLHLPQKQQLLSIDKTVSRMIQESGYHGHLDGADVLVLPQDMFAWNTIDVNDGFAIGFDNQNSTLAMLMFPWSHWIERASPLLSDHTLDRFGIKFSNYRAMTDLVDAGCTITGEAAAQELLSQPELRAHLEGRLRQFQQHAAALRSIPLAARVFAAIPTEVVDLFLPERSAGSDLDVLSEGVRSTNGDHTMALSLMLLGLIVVGGCLMLRRALSEGQEDDSYEDTTP